LRESCNNTDRDIISANIRRIVKSKRIKYSEIAEALSVNIQTVYSYTKKSGYTVKPEPFTLLLLSTYLHVDVAEFFYNV
ncbi:helix-turn-helix transcriptional regulator, partial [Paenibacillus alvei]|uniref:helix-turn-helix domain-containing protein n=1 Tax=Paenibacillus alvei TaxID=44250 RepID=UPI002283E2DF